MIGQVRNKELLMQWRMNKSIPRFIILEGEEGSGRLTFAKLIIEQIHATGIISEISKSAVNEIIENAYTVTSTTCYIFEDADEMSTEAKNSLLKVVEEPPNNAYFIMTIRNKDNMLATILSRGTLVRMEAYTQEQLRQFSQDDYILLLAHTLGDCKEYSLEKCEAAIKLSSNICNALQNKKGVEVLKYCTELKAKDTEEEKIDCELFFRAFKIEFYSIVKYTSFVEPVQEAGRMMLYKSINKKSLIESMLIKILQEYKNAEVS